MSTMSQLYGGGAGPVSAIVNYFSSGGTSAPSNIGVGLVNNSKEVLSGSLTANTLASLPGFPQTGRGRLNLLTAFTKDATSRTIRVQIVVDGTTIYDATSGAIANTGGGVVPVGVVISSTGALEMQPIDYQSSLDIKVASSLTESNKVACGINHEVWQ